MLVTISNWDYQWKMSFNPNSNKRANTKIKKKSYPPLCFNNNSVSEANSQKHLGMVLENHLSFKEHLTLS